MKLPSDNVSHEKALISIPLSPSTISRIGVASTAMTANDTEKARSTFMIFKSIFLFLIHYYSNLSQVANRLSARAGLMFLQRRFHHQTQLIIIYNTEQSLINRLFLATNGFPTVFL